MAFSFSRRSRAAFVVLQLAAFSTVITACGGGSDSGSGGVIIPPAVQVGTVTVSLPASQLQVGAQQAASVEVRSTTGALLTGRAVAWASSNTGTATVADGGAITAVAPGTATISATSEGRTGTATLTVVPVPVTTVVVSAPSNTVATDRTLQLVVALRDERGGSLSDRTVTWSSSAPAVAIVDGNGLVTGLSTGSTTITATSEGRSGSITLAVVPPSVSAVNLTLAQSTIATGGTTTAQAVLRDDRGTVLQGRTVTFASANSSVATVSATGVVSAIGVGTTIITATSEGQSGSAALSVIQAPVATVVLSSPLTNLTVGTSTQVVLTLRAADGSTLTGRTVNWTSSASGVASVSNGLVTTVAPGNATITATSEGISGSISFTVQAPAPATVEVSPPSATITVGRTTTLTATVRDASGNTLTGAGVAWNSSSVGVATISPTGVVTAISPGVTTILALSGGRIGSAQITVQNVAAASVALDVSAVTLTVGEVRLVRATVRDALQNVLRGRDVRWTTSNSSVVDGQVLGDSAVITGLAAGTATISATVEGRSVSAVITVVSGGQSVCAAIAGALLYGDDGQYLGRFANRFDAQSVLNEFGSYGSPYSSTSSNNTYGTYGSPYSSLSARNPYASRPPIIVKNGQALAYYSVNSALSPRVSPALALSCNFP